MNQLRNVRSAKSTLIWLAMAVITAILPHSTLADSLADAFQRINWTVGPATVQLGNVARLNLPAGYRFAGADGAKIWYEATQNPTDGSEVGVLIPPLDSSGDLTQPWFLMFCYDDIGHVNDDEKGNLDSQTIDAVLTSVRQATDQANTERQQRGWGTLQVTGWQQQPFYDTVTHNLTWAIDATDGNGNRTCNYDSRVLGRQGVIRVRLLLSPEQLDATVPTYQSIVGGITFNSGQTYAEFREGDKVAKYGLLGLITGGVAVAAVKGFPILLKLGAAIIAILAGIGATIKKFFNRMMPKPAIAAASTGTTSSSSASDQEFAVVKCPVCGQSNRIHRGAAANHAVCGRCKAVLHLSK